MVPLLTPHSGYLAPGSDPTAGASMYRALFADALPDNLVEEIRSYPQPSQQRRNRRGGDPAAVGGRDCAIRDPAGNLRRVQERR